MWLSMWVPVIYHSKTNWKNLSNNYFSVITLHTQNVITDHPSGANNEELTKMSKYSVRKAREQKREDASM